MSSNSFQSVVDVPELVLLIAQYLNPSDIVSCMATCKRLARDLEPCIWRHLSIKSKAPPREALLRNRHHIRTFHPQEYYGESWLRILAEGLPLACRPYKGRRVAPANAVLENPPINLRVINLSIFPWGEAARLAVIDNLTSISHQSFRCLCVLAIPTWLLLLNPYRCLVRKHILNYMPNLNRLTVGNGGFVCLGTVALFLMQCFRHPRLTSLHCKFYLKSGHTDEKLQAMFQSLTDAIQSKEGTELSRINDLGLPWSKRGYPTSILLPFLTVQGPSLEKMFVPAVADVYNNQLVQTIEQYCSNLRHLSVAWDCRTWSEDRAAIAVIRGCRSGLKSFSSFLDAKYRGLMCDVIKTLVDYHYATLERVEFAHDECDSDSQYLLLEKCPNLERLWINPKAANPTDGLAIVCRPNIADWACLRIRELGLTYQDGRKHAMQAIELYTQIGRLAHLEYLAIGRSVFTRFAYEYDLTFQYGWLSKLEGLKKLKRLHITTDLWSQMDQREIEFIHQNWPALQMVSFGCRVEVFDQIRSSPHWKWLCEMRPWLQLEHGYHP